MKELNRITEIPFIKLNKKKAQLFLNKIKHLFKSDTILNNKYESLLEKEYILFPLINDENIINTLKTSIEGSIDFQILFKKGVLKKNYKFKSIQEALEDLVPEHYYKYIPRSYDIIGDIAIIEFDKNIDSIIKESSNFKENIAKALIKVNKNVRSIFEKESEIKGSFRLRELKFLIGENRSLTRHKENDCMFEVDVKTTFFTPRLVFERNRIASSNFKKNETIIDMFAGVGPFSIQIAKKTNSKILSFDINPKAYDLLLKNISLNKLEGRIIPYNIDIQTLLNPSSDLGTSLKYEADRIIMNLPERSLDFIDVACFLLKKTGGIIHNYQFSEKPNPVENAIDKLKKKLERNKYSIEDILNSKIVKNFSPKSDLVVVDLLVSKN